MSITDENGGPKSAESTLTGASHARSNSTCYARSVRVRRSASYRLPGGDPWIYPAPTAGYEAAIEHLSAAGLTPAPDRGALRRMYKAGGYQRRAAERIAKAWDLAND
jgi:hypothetical protein